MHICQIVKSVLSLRRERKMKRRLEVLTRDVTGRGSSGSVHVGPPAAVR